MHKKRTRWLVYTVLVGLIPIVSRAFAWLVTRHGTLDAIAAADFVAFGLVLHISAINELDHFSTDDSSWKTAQNGVAVFFVALYSVLYSVDLVGAMVVEKLTLKYCVMILACISFLLNYSVFKDLDGADGRKV